MSRMKRTEGKNSEKTVSVSTQASNGLTCIQSRIHCPATQPDVEAEYDELNEIAIEHFLDVLAEVALSVAARGIEEDQSRND